MNATQGLTTTFLDEAATAPDIEVMLRIGVAMESSPATISTLLAYYMQLETEVNRCFRCDGDVSASEHLQCVYQILVSATRSVGASCYSAGHRFAQCEILEGVSRAEDTRS